MKQRYYWMRLLVIVSMMFFVAGCNKEKAEAIKVAAGKFRVEAVAAITKINALFLQSIALPADEEDEVKRIARDLETEVKIEANGLATILSEGDIGKETMEKVTRDFETIGRNYYQFEEMFRSLPKTTFLARGAVKKAEKHAIHLTVQMIRFADNLKARPVIYTGRRTLIVERVEEAKQIQDENLRRERLAGVAKDILQLRKDEQEANQEVILQCLKAAETGRLAAQLIRDYNALSVEEMLIAVGNTLGFVAEISGGRREVVGLLEKYKAVETMILEDPYWKEILSERIQ